MLALIGLHDSRVFDFIGIGSDVDTGAKLEEASFEFAPTGATIRRKLVSRERKVNEKVRFARRIRRIFGRR
jgi:hypothetical protein